MMFLNLFLAGFAVLGAVPIIIHLLNKRKFRVVTWAAMEFLLTTMEKNSRRLQLRDIILLALRVLAIVLLALALARPTIAPGQLSLLGGKGETTAVLVLDNSLSMGCQVGNETRYALAKRKAKEILDQLPKGSSAALVLMSDVAIDEIPEPTHDLEFVAAEIAKAALSDGGTDIAAGMAQAWSMLKGSSTASREIYLITDLQRSGWPLSAEAPAWAKLAADIKGTRPSPKLYVAAVGDDESGNVGIDSFRSEDELVTTGSDVAFLATLRNHSAIPAANVTVELLVGDGLGGEMRSVASLVVDHLESEQQVRLETRFADGGPHRVEIRAGIDRLPADNARHLSLDVLDRIRVLVIDGDPAGPGEDFGGESDFVRAALSPRVIDDGDRAAAIETEVTTVGGLGDKSLRDYQAVILANVGELPPSLVEGLKTLVKAEGRGLMVFLGGNVDGKRYNELLLDQAGLLPARLGERPVEHAGPESAKERGIGLATDELSHPVVAFFAEAATQPFLSKPRFTKSFPLTLDEPVPPAAAPAAAAAGAAAPAAAASGERVAVIARFADGNPAMVERRVGRGTVILFNCTADKEWTDLPLRPAFLIVLRRAAQHLTLGRRFERTVQVNEAMVAALAAKEAGAQIEVRDPRGGVRRTTALLSPSGDLVKVEVVDSPFAGFYRLNRDGAPPWTAWFAANPPRAESNLDPLDEKGLRSLSGDLDFQFIARRDDLAQAITEERVGREIWYILLALAAACLFTESFLATRWAPKGA